MQTILVPDSDDDDIVLHVEDAFDVGSDGGKLEPFGNKSSSHLPAKSVDPSKLFQCLVCDLQFTRKSLSMRHILKHIGQPSVVLVRLSVKDDIEYKKYLERNSIFESPKPKRQRKDTVVASGTKSILPCSSSTDDVQIINEVSPIGVDKISKTYSCNDCKISYLHEFLLEEHQQITGHGCDVTPRPDMAMIQDTPSKIEHNSIFTNLNTIPIPNRERKDSIVTVGTKSILQLLQSTEHVKIDEEGSMEVDQISKTYSCCDCNISYLHQCFLEEHQRLTGHGIKIAPKPMVVIPVTPSEIKEGSIISTLNTIPNTNHFACPLQSHQSTNIQLVTSTAAQREIHSTMPAAQKKIQSVATSAPIDKIPSMLTIRTIRPQYSANTQTQQQSQTTVSTVTMSLPPSLIIRKTSPQPVIRHPVQPMRSALFGHQQINVQPAVQPVPELSLIGRPGIRCVLSSNAVPVRPASPNPTNTVDAQFRLFGGLCTPNITTQIRQPMLHRPPSSTIIRQHYRPPAHQRMVNQVQPRVAIRTVHPMTYRPHSGNPLTVRVRLPNMPVPPLSFHNSGQLTPSTQMLVSPNDNMSSMIVNQQPRTIGMPFIESVTGGAIFKVNRPTAPTVPIRYNLPTTVRPFVNTVRRPLQIRPHAHPASHTNPAMPRTPILSLPNETNPNTLLIARSTFDMMHEHENDAETILS